MENLFKLSVTSIISLACSSEPLVTFFTASKTLATEDDNSSEIILKTSALSSKSLLFSLTPLTIWLNLLTVWLIFVERCFIMTYLFSTEKFNNQT